MDRKSDFSLWKACFSIVNLRGEMHCMLLQFGVENRGNWLMQIVHEIKRKFSNKTSHLAWKKLYNDYVECRRRVENSLVCATEIWSCKKGHLNNSRRQDQNVQPGEIFVDVNNFI